MPSLQKQCQRFLKQELNKLNRGNYAAALADFYKAANYYLDNLQVQIR